MEPDNPKIEYIKSKRNKTKIIIDNKYIYNYYTKDANGNSTNRCVDFKKISKCLSLIKLDINKNIIKYDKYHNHIVSNKEAPKRKAKSEIKNLIKNTKNPLALKPKDIYQESTKNLGLIIPEYKTVKSVINRNINMNFPKEIKTWEQIPEDHEFYYTISDEKFLVKKEEDFILFQSKYAAKLHLQYPEHIFCDATYYCAPALCYQLLITRIYSKELNSFFTTSYSLMKNKLQKTYENIFNNLKKNIENYSNNKQYKPNEFHCDLEISISNAISAIFPHIKIRYCLWHMGRALEANKKKYLKDDDNDLYILYKCIINLAYIDPIYVIPVFN